MRGWRQALRHYDARLFWYVHLRLARRWLDRFMGGITHLGGVLANAGLGLVLTAYPGELRKVGLSTLAALSFSHLVVQLLKRQVERRRPYLALADSRLIVTPLSDYSFPSGHTTASFATATVLSAHWPSLTLPLMLLAATVGISRTYLGHHYPSDVVVGALIGMLSAYLSVNWLLA